ncbi:MAG: hypothetical protein GY942_07455 [Aestuariibacter sp.]|nr:hypothetical protein [Aestuariibacter sp.]
MTISNDIMYAILAMDSYDRGYGEGIAGLGGVGSTIGIAQLTKQSDTAEDTAGVTASFYAAAYSYNSETVISYRGTNSAPFSELSKDALYGWGVGVGSAEETQGVLAAQFYKSVANDAETGEAHLFDSGIQLVGHSLGVGLAGTVADL